jgi:hypothetical protein
MDPLRKDEKLTAAEIAKSGESKKEQKTTPSPEQDAAELETGPRTAGPRTAGARATEYEKGEGQESRASGPRLVSQGAKRVGEARSMPLFPQDELQEMRSRWDKIQAAFVDQPRQAVEDADNLVATVIQRLAGQFAEERASVERQWSSGESVSTEVLRQSLRRYRSFFERLLSV